MSLLLNSLKKADSENQKAADTATQTTPEAALAPAVAAPPGAGETIDFDSIVDESAAASDVAGGESGRAKELVSASRVFKAGGEQEEMASSGFVRTILYSVLGLGILFGGSYGLIASGLIPGVSATSLLGLLGSQEVAAPVVQKQDSGPVLAVASGGKVLPLPQPRVDIQADIDYAGLQAPDPSLLETADGRREYAEKVAILAGVGLGDGEGFDEESALELLNLSNGVEEEQELVEVPEITGVKTAAVSRIRKKFLDAKTPSDRVLLRRVELHVSPGAVAQATTGSGVTEESAPVQPAASDAREIKVVLSMSGSDRRRLLRDASRLYGNGAYAEAESVYRGILVKNKTNIDALRGVALVAVATGRYQLAVATYLKILEYYPNDPVAVADLANLHGVADKNVYAVEGALKKIIGERPEWDSRLYFALGNLYAGDRRWTDAQQAYFKAYAEEQGNPDYAYNLAVVLDYLNKPELAVRYYREALTLSGSSPSGFNANEVRARIDSILN